MVMGMIRYWTYRNMKTLGNYYNDAINFVLIVISGLGMTEHSYPSSQLVRIIYGLEMFAGVAECFVALLTFYYLISYCCRGTGISDQYHDNLAFDITSPKFTV